MCHIRNSSDECGATLSALIPILGQQAYNGVGEWTEPPGHVVSGWLAVMIARRTLPLWESVQTGASEPRQFIQLTSIFLRENAKLEKANERWNRSQS